MPESTYLGGTYKVYESSIESIGSYTDAYNDFINNARFVKEIPLIFPYVEGDSTGIIGSDLFQAGNIINETALKLDTWSPLWQQMTLFYYVVPNYENYGSTRVPVSVMDLFPNKFQLPHGVAVYITRDDITSVVYYHQQVVGAFNKRTGARITSSIVAPRVYFVNVGSNNAKCFQAWGFYKNNGSFPYQFSILSSLGYDTAHQKAGYWWLGNAITSSTPSCDFYAKLQLDYVPPAPPPEGDPYAPGGYSGGDLTEGDFDFEGDPQPLGPVPSWVKTGLDTGFYTLYNPSAAELQNLASYLWSNSFDLDMLKKLFNNPMDLILNFGVVPCPIQSGGQKEVGIGLISTGVMMNTAAERHVYQSMGSCFISPAYKAYLDWSPYTRCDLILPFVGVIPIDIDAIMGRSLQIVYNIDILTGACVAGLNVLNAGESTWENAHSIGEYAGNCMMPLPLTGSDYSNMISGLIQTAGTIAAGVATGGGAGAVAGGLSAASSAIVNEGKPLIQKGGAISSAAGYLGHLKPTLIFSIPKQCLPSTQIGEEGFPAFVSGLIGDITGFAKVYEVHLDNIPATDEELEEIEAILKGGFYA